MTTRVTQGGGYVVAKSTTGSDHTRVTQGGGYALMLSAAFGARLTQGGGYAIARADTGHDHVRVTQAAGYVIARRLVPPCLTSSATCWRIQRQDGEVFAFTAHDQDVSFRGDIYEACGSLLASALQTSAEFAATENMDLSGIIAAGAFTQEDLWTGIWDGAEVQVWKVDWKDPTQGELMAAGQTGSVSFTDGSFKFEVTTAGQRLQQRPILQPVMPTCRYKLGDSRCTINLEALRVFGSVTSVASPDYRIGAEQRVFTDTIRAEVDNYFQLGSVRWETGDNAGQQIDVKVFADGTFILERPAEFSIQIGDTYSAVPGCDLIFETCDLKFNNAINFGGYPDLRGTDDLQKTPGFKQ